MREKYGLNFSEFYHDTNALDKVFDMHQHDSEGRAFGVDPHLFATALGKVMTSHRIDVLLYHYGNKKSLSREDFIRSQEAYENVTYRQIKSPNPKHMLTFAVFNKSRTG